MSHINFTQIRVRHGIALISDLASNFFDKMEEDTRDVSRFVLFMKCLLIKI